MVCLVFCVRTFAVKHPHRYVFNPYVSQLTDWRSLAYHGYRRCFGVEALFESNFSRRVLEVSLSSAQGSLATRMLLRPDYCVSE